MPGDENAQWIAWLRKQRASYLDLLGHASNHYCCAHQRDALETCVRLVSSELRRRDA